MELKNLFRRKVKLQITVTRDPFKLTLNEWRADENLVVTARKVLNDPNVRLMLQTLYNSSPAWEVLSGVRGEERVVQQSRIEGYTMALANLESLGAFQPISEPVEATWEPEEKQTQ